MSAFPSADPTNFDLDAFTRAAVERSKDTLYTAVGLGVLALQRLQVRRREIEKTLRG